MNKPRRHLTNKERAPYWLQIINAWQTSGKKTEQFCKDNKIAVSSFYQWRKRLKPDYPLRSKRVEPAATKRALFVPVQIEHDSLPGNGGDITLHYPNGCYVNLGKGFDLHILSWLNKSMGI
jgi:hypothetical protein